MPNVQEELSDLRDLIKDTEKLMDKYPGRFSLKMSLHSLKVREQEILKELRMNGLLH
jgi:hypothetical protein